MRLDGSEARIHYVQHGAGPDIVYWGFLLLLSGLPVYTWVVRQRRTAPSA